MSKIIFNGVDYAGGSGNYFNPVIYSDVERKVGVWRDNKPLYAKTLNFSGINVDNNNTTIGTISNLDTFVKGIGTAKEGSYTYAIAEMGMRIRADASGNVTLRAMNNATWSNISGSVCVFYTKTTDVAGSGDYNTYGVPTVHYSTSEQVIGTWINGKPIYQRTWDFSGSPIMTPYAQWVDTGISASVNIDKIISAESRYGTAVNSGIEFGAGAGGFVVGAEKYDPINNTRGIDQLTLRYTKTTD